MDFKTAIEILELDPNNLSLDLIKKAYRHLSLKYHPDVSSNTDGAKFILINAAYEFLLKNLHFFNPDEYYETEDELTNRIKAIKKSFEMIRTEYYDKHNEIFQRMVNNLIDTLNNYNSYKRLEEGVNFDFPRIVEGGINDIISWFDSKISQIISSYDDWINGYLRSTYQKLLKDEFQCWYKSKYFYTHLFVAIIISEIIFTGVYYFSFESYYASISAIPILAGIICYRRNVKRKYNFEEKIIKLDSNKFKVHSSSLFIESNDGFSIGETTLGLGTIGAAIGMIGGPVGALFGGAIGGFLGSLLGESLDELKQKLFKRMILKLEEVEQRILNNLDEQIPKIEEELIVSIKENFNRNKERAVKLLLN
jgi:curved DNA-binding protein CbpA